MKKPEHHDTAEHLLSPEAIERALDGSASAEKAKAFGTYLEENPEARAALQRFKQAKDDTEVRHTGLQLLEQTKQADANGVAVSPATSEAPRKKKGRFIWAAVGLLGAIVLLLFAILRSGRKPEAVMTSPATTETTEEPVSTATATITVPLPASTPSTTALPDGSSEESVPSSTARTTARASSIAKAIENPKPPDTAKPQPTPSSSSKLFFPDE